MTKTISEASGLITASRRFGSASIEVICSSTKCELVQVGVKQVEREKVLVPAVTETEIVEEPVFERRCSPVLAAVGTISQTEADAAVDAFEPF